MPKKDAEASTIDAIRQKLEKKKASYLEKVSEIDTKISFLQEIRAEFAETDEPTINLGKTVQTISPYQDLPIREICIKIIKERKNNRFGLRGSDLIEAIAASGYKAPDGANLKQIGDRVYAALANNKKIFTRVSKGRYRLA
jgi:hypothetical protein